MISTLKILSTIFVIAGIVIGYLDLKYEPQGLLLESSPNRPAWLLPWLGWAITSAAAILYIVLDHIESKYRAFQ